jgi:lysophospholipase L1-like esterase
MKNILCYGDSNTWGYTPGTGERYPRNIRWTGIMADALGDDYYVIEAGLGGRTTVYTDPMNPILNGLEYLPMILKQSAPLDLVIIALGSNDMKFVDAIKSARGMEKLVDVCKRANDAMSNTSPVLNEGAKILVVSPTHISKRVHELNPYSTFLAHASEESKKFGEIFGHYAKLLNVEFFDAATVASPSDVDGLHMTPESHKALAVAITKKVRKILE